MKRVWQPSPLFESMEDVEKRQSEAKGEGKEGRRMRREKKRKRTCGPKRETNLCCQSNKSPCISDLICLITALQPGQPGMLAGWQTGGTGGLEMTGRGETNRGDARLLV